MLVVAVAFALILLVLGYRTLIVPKSRQRWTREFWFSVLIIMAIAYSLTCSRDPTKLENTSEWKNLLEQWETVSNLKDDQLYDYELSKVHRKTEKCINNLKGLVGKGVISLALVELLHKDLEQLQRVMPKIPPNVNCYSRVVILAPMEAWEQLRIKLPLLEKVVQESKVNDWAYQKVIARLRLDLENLDKINDNNEKTGWNNYKTNQHINDGDIEAIKAKARELIDRAEKSIQK